MDNSIVKDRVIFFFFGVIAVFLLIILTGTSKAPPPHYGRYQISSFATSVENNTAIIGAFVVDTATGETKTVYSRTLKNIDQNQIFINNLKRSFSTMD